MHRHAMVGVLFAGWLGLAATEGLAQGLTSVSTANPKATGVPAPNVLSPELAEVIRAQGAMLLENPAPLARYYGYNDDQPNLLPPLGSNVEATKTEPDKNTYLVLENQRGADPGYDYGTHFILQGHEGGPGTSPNKGTSPVSIWMPMSRTASR